MRHSKGIDYFGKEIIIGIRKKVLFHRQSIPFFKNSFINMKGVYAVKNNNQKFIGKILAILGVPLLIIGIVATAISATNFSIVLTLLGMALGGIAFILLSDIFAG